MEDCQALYITGNMDWQYNCSMAEILSHYACRIDAAYYQGMTLTTGGRTLRPYEERYHFVDVDDMKEEEDSLYLLHASELDRLPFAFRVIKENGNFRLVRPAD